MPKQFRYDYYDVEVPSDYSEDRDERANVAFMGAEEMTRIFAMPCDWCAIRDTGEVVTVRRRRIRH